MPATRTGATAPPPQGPVETIRSFMANWIAILKTRVELISTEIEEQREWLQSTIIMAVAAGFLISLGLVLMTFFVVVIFWDTARLWVLGGFTVLYLGGGILLAAILRQRVQSRPRFLSTTASELGKDYSALQPRSS